MKAWHGCDETGVWPATGSEGHGPQNISGRLAKAHQRSESHYLSNISRHSATPRQPLKRVQTCGKDAKSVVIKDSDCFSPALTGWVAGLDSARRGSLHGFKAALSLNLGQQVCHLPLHHSCFPGELCCGLIGESFAFSPRSCQPWQLRG